MSHRPSLPHHVFMLGIGGIGMSALARHLSQQGHRVAGYDLTPSPVTSALIAEGIDVMFEPDAESLPSWVVQTPAEDLLVVHTPAVPRDLPLRVWLDSRGIQPMKRAELLGRLTADRPTLAVAGTHGKTTTSSWLAHILNETEAGCHAFLGGIDASTGTNYLSRPGAEWHVVEADEFDRSFHQLHPNHAAITNLDPDHLDIYGDAQSFREAFEQFGSQVSGTLILPMDLSWTDHPSPPSVERFAVGKDIHALEGADHQALVGPQGETTFWLHRGSPEEIRFQAKPALPGTHNAANALVAAALSHKAGVPAELLARGIAQFGGVKRRMDIHLDTPSGVYVDDYAHHPEELRALLSAVRERWPGRHVTLIFQPHLFSRTRDFGAEFAEVLGTADRLWLLPIYPAREQPIAGVDAQWLFENISGPHKHLSSSETIFTSLKACPVDVLITAGAGDIDRLVPQAIQHMQDRSS